MGRIVTLASILLILLGAENFASAGTARCGGKDRSTGFMQVLEENRERLGLSEDTMAKIREIVSTSRPSSEKLDTELRDAHARMRDLLSENRPDRDAVMAQAERIGTLKTESLQHRLRILLEIRPLLTDVQLAELRLIREQRFSAVSAACQDEIEQLCAETTPGFSRGLCLEEHAKELSPHCLHSLNSLRQKLTAHE